MSYFGKSKNIELSFIKHIEDEINDNWSGYSVRVSESFPDSDENLDIPVICIQLVEPIGDRLELGSNQLYLRYFLSIDIFATNHTERLAIVDFLLEDERLMDGCIYYAHSQNPIDNTQLDLTEDGRVQVLSIETNTKLEFGENVDIKDQHRHLINLIVR